MTININHFISFVILGSLLSACGGTKPKPDPKEMPNFKETQLNNEGSICLYTKKNNDIKVFYFPRNSACSSSSLNRWSNKKLTATASLRRSLKGSVIEIESSVLHRLSNSNIATADCAGAGIQSTLIAMNGVHRFDVLWGKKSIANIENKVGALVCKKMDKNGNVSAAHQSLSQYVLNVARHDP